jgi:phosphodiesterase/alkaline phosphatase D-like protein
MSDPGRSMLGAAQRDWLLSELDSSAADWRLLASPSVMLRSWVEEPDELLKTALVKLKLIDEDGEGPDEEWDGYPAERQALLERLSGLEDVIVLSADIHVSVASELSLGGENVAWSSPLPASRRRTSTLRRLRRGPRPSRGMVADGASAGAVCRRDPRSLL